MDNLPTGESCFGCKMPRYADDGAFTTAIVEAGAIVSWCGGCPMPTPAKVDEGIPMPDDQRWIAVDPAEWLLIQHARGWRHDGAECRWCKETAYFAEIWGRTKRPYARA